MERQVIILVQRTLSASSAYPNSYYTLQYLMSKRIRLKIAIIGPPSSGKSAFITNLLGKPFDPSYTKTEGYELSLFKFSKDRTEYEIQLWDCGSEHKDYNKHIRYAFFKNCSAAFLMFDLSDGKWKDRIEEWLAQAYEFDCFLVYAIGTKKDEFIRLQYEEKYGKQALRASERLSDELLESKGVETLDQLSINAFFDEFQIKHFYQSANEPVYKSIRNIFVQIENDQQKISRSSLAVGRRFDNTVIDIKGEGKLKSPAREKNLEGVFRSEMNPRPESVKMEEIQEERYSMKEDQEK